MTDLDRLIALSRRYGRIIRFLDIFCVSLGAIGSLLFLGFYIGNGYPWFLTLTVIYAAFTAKWLAEITN